MLGSALSGCTQPGLIRWNERLPSPGDKSRATDSGVQPAGHLTQISASHPPAHGTYSELSLDPETKSGSLPLDECIRRALTTNATVRAARFNAEAMRQRIPQVTALDDPILSNTIFPIPSVAPQYSLI
jgi:hypothetical protein